MSRCVEFFFDVGSPSAYLAWTQLPRIAAEADAELLCRPMLLGQVFRAAPNDLHADASADGACAHAALEHFARRHGVPYRPNPHAPIDTLALMRGATGVQLRMHERLADYLRAVFDAMWVHPRNLGDPSELGATLHAAGFDPAEVAALAADPQVKDALRHTTDEALRRGVFGAPAMFVGEQMFFGQDRLDSVREALR